MVEPLQAFHGETGHPERRSAIAGRDEPDATCVVLGPDVDVRSFQLSAPGNWAY
jgi:hypothetical protein